jgi:hypothetical protein
MLTFLDAALVLVGTILGFVIALATFVPRVIKQNKDECLHIVTLNQLATACHANSVVHGFWDVDHDIDTLIGELVDSADASQIGRVLAAAKVARRSERIALVHSELSEMLEACRKNPDGPSEHCPEISAVAEEIADAVIRAGDLAAGYGIDLDSAVEVKMAFNASRPRMHGGKKF